VRWVFILAGLFCSAELDKTEVPINVLGSNVALQVKIRMES